MRKTWHGFPVVCVTIAVLLLFSACGGSVQAGGQGQEQASGKSVSTVPGKAGAAVEDGTGDTGAEAEKKDPEQGGAVNDGTAAAGETSAEETAAGSETGTAAEAAPGATVEAAADKSADQDSAEEAALEEQARELVSSMTMEEKISQMIIPSIRTWNEQDVTDLAADPELAEALQRHQYGGVILFAMNVVNGPQTLKLLSDLQENNAKIPDASVHIPYFTPVDEEGGIVIRLNSGTRMTGNMAVGATGGNAEKNAKLTGQVLGEEMRALGFNVDFAPDIDVNNNPANPVIGTRSFSDDPALVARLGPAFADGLAENHIIATYKHFPGHGDTSVDSHIGTPSVEKTYEELQETELVPFAAAVESGAEMIMTAHITFPQIDEEVTFGDGITKGFYPATMSKKMITGILRGDLGFDGVVVTDALEMDAIDKGGLVPGEAGSEEYAANIAEKVINAGVDLLLMPRDLINASAADFYDAFIADLESRVSSGTIPKERIDESVARILRLKLRNGILTGAEDAETTANTEAAQTGATGPAAGETAEVLENGTSDEDRGEDGASSEGGTVTDAVEALEGSNVTPDPVPNLLTVGSDEHHETEMEIARQAVTLVKNDNDTLPASGKGTGIVILGRLPEDNISINAVVNSLREQGILDESAYVTTDYYYDLSAEEPAMRYTEEMRYAIMNADYVVGTTRTYGVDSLYTGNPQYEAIRTAIEDTHAGGGKFILLSENLPYDAARYQDADAIVLAYMGSGLDVDPTARGGEGLDRPAGNANVAAALATIFGGNTPQGTLPVNIPVIEEQEDGSLTYGSEWLYERGSGLTYGE